MIAFKQVTKTYQGADALSGLSLTIADGEFFVLVGPSGSGKTTLLKMVNRLVVPTSGTVELDGVDVATMDLAALRRHTGYVLQSSALFPNMTVGQNAGVQLEALGWPGAKREARVRELLGRVGLEPQTYYGRMPAELSGGEAQRVGIVRALAGAPKLILMDEPFSALDPLSRRQLQALIAQLHQELQVTIVFVTHDMQEALTLADRLAVIHTGTLQQVGAPEAITTAPANAFVAEFFAQSAPTRPTLAQVLAAGFGRPVVATDTPQPLAAHASLSAWAAVVQREPTQTVAVGEKLLTAADLIAYLAKEEGHD
ncbi:ABC transporter ATP-binding protein [Lacticaseibacillus absianus]|uniref:ABC transporter ATP-binding protein n=1 Tax=Lacticaseibacillus absianus TaxID=2729623 RepID=UPI0015CCF626|nr:ABC transporter ATP-binding protein [Lacticaseibacillus absianus]